MPYRRRRVRRPVRGRARRNTTWVDLAAQSQSSDTAANTLSENQLFLMSDELEATTVLRIVGTIFMGLQSDSAIVTMGYWGLFKFDGDSDTTINPASLTGVSSENLMMWKAVPMATIDSGLGPQWKDFEVDIRAKRKLVAGDSLSLNFFCTSLAYSHIHALRGLFYAD